MVEGSCGPRVSLELDDVFLLVHVAGDAPRVLADP
jgi:hypothetical protein